MKKYIFIKRSIYIFIFLLLTFSVRDNENNHHILGFPPQSVAHAQGCVSLNGLHVGNNAINGQFGLQADVSTSCTGTYLIYFDLTCEGVGECPSSFSTNEFTGPISGPFNIVPTVKGTTRYNVRVTRAGTNDYTGFMTCVTNDANDACVSPAPDDDGDGVPDYRDTCRGSNSIGFGVYPNGCPILDTDGDGVPDPDDACPNQGSIGHGIYANGCPILDTDGDGVPDNLDHCPNDPGLSPHGCPDTDGGGIADHEDACPYEPGPASNNGCPYPDTDGDGIPDHLDACPNEPGPASNNGCPLGTPPPPTSEPPPPAPVIPSLPDCPDGAPRLEDGTCPAYQPPVPIKPQIQDTDGDGIPDDRDVCPQEPGPEANGGCPYQPANCQVANQSLINTRIRSAATTESNSNIIGFITFRDMPLDVLSVYGDWYQVSFNNGLGFIRNDVVKAGDTMIGCADFTADKDSINEAFEIFMQEGCLPNYTNTVFNKFVGSPEYVHYLIAYSDDPCVALQRFAALNIPDAYNNLVDLYPERQELLDELAICAPEFLTHISDTLSQNLYVTITRQTLQTLNNTADLCDILSDFKSGEDSDFGADLSQEQAALIGVALCGNTSMNNAHYQTTVKNIVEGWNIPSHAINCALVNQIIRVGGTSEIRGILVDKMVNECEFSFDKSFAYLENGILSNTIYNKQDTERLDCDQIEEMFGCTTCDYDLTLRDQDTIFNACIENAYMKRLITIFIRVHKDKELTELELTRIYNAEAPCDAAIRYIHTGLTRPLQKGIVSPPTEDEEEVTPTPIPTSAPSEPSGAEPVQPTPIDPTPTPTPIYEPITVPENSGSGSGLFDNILEPSFFGARSIFIRENNGLYHLYVVQNGEEVRVDAEQTGRKFHPILFDYNGNTILAYLLERGDEIVLRLVNLDTTFDGYNNVLEPALSPEPIISKIAFISPYIFYVATDGKLYAHNFERNETIELIEDVMNPSSMNNGLVFESVGDESGIYAWVNGGILQLDTILNDCHHPIARQSGSSMPIWLICDGQVNRTDIFKPGQIELLDISLTVIEITLGELAADLYIGDGNNIYRYRYNEENDRFEETPVIGGSEQEKTIHLFIITN